MNHLSDERAQALGNTRALLDEARWFPENVFRGQWSGFFFFDSDWMFDGAFVERAQTLLRIDGGTCVCLVNFDRTVRIDDRLFFIDGETTADAYQQVLFGARSGERGQPDIPFGLGHGHARELTQTRSSDHDDRAQLIRKFNRERSEESTPRG